jgi:hypothetical protein
LANAPAGSAVKRAASIYFRIPSRSVAIVPDAEHGVPPGSVLGDGLGVNGKQFTDPRYDGRRYRILGI